MIEVASRKVMVSPEVMGQWTRWRTPDGYLVTCVWGEPDHDGFYNPAFTVHNDDRRCEDTEYVGPSLARGATI